MVGVSSEKFIQFAEQQTSLHKVAHIYRELALPRMICWSRRRLPSPFSTR